MSDKKRVDFASEKLVDMTDDWMNPSPTSFSGGLIFKQPQPSDPTEYLIERMRKTICFGNPGYTTSWDLWRKYETAEERDSALADLRKNHPVWILRSRDSHPYFDQLRAVY